MSMKLRDLIRAVRACKTAAEERAVISKECALIRTAIKEEDEQYRHRNVAKLMYIHMLGYPTHFGQMECLKLISSPGFPEKRVGYLALTLLLNEQTEILTLVTNALKIDLSNSSQFIQALSLITIGNLATQDMARDLASDVEKLLRTSNSYIRKKAVLATIRLLRKEPDLIEHMQDRITHLLKDRSHGVVLTTLQLIIEILELIPSTLNEYIKLVPSLVRLLRNFISMGFSPEHDVGGITDPFTQVKLLQLLRKLGKNHDEASEQMNDVLAQVATNTETAKNAGNAILYECVQTIMEVNSDNNLRVLAVNILGRFLLNRDNNIRYVALNSLSRIVVEDINSVQRHRNTIVDCLKDADISIRQRAMELIYQLVDEQNVTLLTSELLNYLIVAQSEHKPNLVSKIIQIVEKYANNKKWRVDTIITMLTISGNQVDDSVHKTAIIILSQSDTLHNYIIHRLYRAISDDTSQQALLHVTIWCIGEYGQLLTSTCTSQNTDNGSIETFSSITETEIITLLDKCLRIHNSDQTTKSFVLNALIKLSVRFSQQSSKMKIQELITPFKSSLSIELQQRSLEYISILNGKWDGLRSNVLSNMPHVDEAVLRRRKAAFDEDSGSSNNGNNNTTTTTTRAATTTTASSTAASGALAKPAVGGGTSLIDLDDIFGLGTTPAAPVAPVPTGLGLPTPGFPTAPLGITPAVTANTTTSAAPQPPKPASNIDLLADIFSVSTTVTPSQPTQPIAPSFPSTGLSGPTPVMMTPGFPMMNPGMGMPMGMPPMGVPGTMPMGMPPGPGTMPMMMNTPPAAMLPQGGGFPPNPTPMNAIPPMGMSVPTLSTASTSSSLPTMIAYEKDGLKITMDATKPNPATPANTVITCRYSNATNTPFTDFVFQAAVPKYMKLEMLPPSNTTIPAFSTNTVTQEIRVNNSVQGEKPIMLKLKISYKNNGTPVEAMGSVSSFPPTY